MHGASNLMAQCVCGRWAPADRLERSAGRTETGDLGWIVAYHVCACYREFRAAHDTQGRMVAYAERATENPLPGSWAR